MRHLLCSSTPTFRMTVSFVRTLKVFIFPLRSSHFKGLVNKGGPCLHIWDSYTDLCSQSRTRHYTHASMNDTFISACLEDWDSCFAQHRHEGSVVFCPQHSGPSCPCAQMTRPTSERQESPVWQQAEGSVVLRCLLVPLSPVQSSYVDLQS